jgi:PAS domain S-box-containing protein
MVEPYRILIVEDDPAHAELIRRGFKRHDEFFLDFAATGEEGLEMIENGSYDLISIDLVLPGIGGLDVLVRVRKFDQDIPVVMVSGHGTTEMAVVAFENRATKYVVKSIESFKSLPYIFENLIQEARFKANERAMMAQIERSERIHRNIVENALAGIYILQDGVFKLVNPKLGEIFGCSHEALVGVPFWKLVQPDDLVCVNKLEKEAGAGDAVPAYESKVCRRDGQTRWVEFRTVPIEYEGKRAVLGNIIDITSRKEQDLELQRSNRKLMAINSIMAQSASPVDLDEALNKALADVLAGLGGFEIGGIFLLDGGKLVLRALCGSVEELVYFIEGVSQDDLVKGSKIHETKGDADKFWASAPISCSGTKRGTLIVASKTGFSDQFCTSFLEELASHIGRLVEICTHRSAAPPSIPADV